MSFRTQQLCQYPGNFQRFDEIFHGNGKLQRVGDAFRWQIVYSVNTIQRFVSLTTVLCSNEK